MAKGKNGNKVYREDFTRAVHAKLLADGHPPVTLKEVESVVLAYNEVVKQTLAKGDEIVLVGFGTFKARARAARKGYDPARREAIEIPARKTPFFTPSKIFKKALND
jgi:nucleoid DNA-binding protein